jgi:hypothetical protein
MIILFYIGSLYQKDMLRIVFQQNFFFVTPISNLWKVDISFRCLTVFDWFMCHENHSGLSQCKWWCNCNISFEAIYWNMRRHHSCKFWDTFFSEMTFFLIYPTEHLFWSFSSLIHLCFTPFMLVVSFLFSLF